MAQEADSEPQGFRRISRFPAKDVLRTRRTGELMTGHVYAFEADAQLGYYVVVKIFGAAGKITYASAEYPTNSHGVRVHGVWPRVAHFLDIQPSLRIDTAKDPDASQTLTRLAGYLGGRVLAALADPHLRSEERSSKMPGETLGEELG